MNHDVFISYSSMNITAAQAVCHELEEHGIRCWMAPRDIPVGAKYASIITHAIKECKVVVLVFSEYSALSPWVESEINLAFSNRKPIIPYKIDQSNLGDYEEFYLMLNNRHWIEAYPDFRTRFADLVVVVANAVGVALPTKPRSQAAAAPVAASEPSKTYAVGDYYNENGKEGIVFEVDATGRHGKIMAMRDLPEELAWGLEEVKTGAWNMLDGIQNLKVIQQIVGWKTKYPAFVASLVAPDWYLPAIKELEMIYINRERLSQICMHYGGNSLMEVDKDYWIYWSSTENGENSAWSVMPSGIVGNYCGVVKERKSCIRLISVF